MDIHITRKGEQHGPYPEANAREMLAVGKLLPTDLAWHAGADGWKPLSEVLGSTPAAAQAPPPPPPKSAAGGPQKRQLAGAKLEEEKDDSSKIHVTRKGEPIGPYSREKAKEYFIAGTLLPTDWGWHDGMGEDWKPLNEVLELPVKLTKTSSENSESSTSIYGIKKKKKDSYTDPLSDKVIISDKAIKWITGFAFFVGCFGHLLTFMGAWDYLQSNPLPPVDREYFFGKTVLVGWVTAGATWVLLFILNVIFKRM